MIAARSNRGSTIIVCVVVGIVVGCVGVLGFLGVLALSDQVGRVADEIGRGSAAAEAISSFLTGQVVDGTHHPGPIQQWVKAAAAALVGYGVTGITSAAALVRAALVGVFSTLAYFFWK